jgi:hypothetical protein
MTVSPSRSEARSRLGFQSANELGAPVVSSIPEQLPGQEPASARKGYEDALLRRNRRVERSLGHRCVARGQSWTMTNDATGWIALVERLRDFSIAAIGLEASGGYERGVARALCAAGMSVRQVNPFKLRQFARASGVLAKNDPLDARMIASFVAVMPTRPAQRRRHPNSLPRCSRFAASSASSGWLAATREVTMHRAYAFALRRSGLAGDALRAAEPVAQAAVAASARSIQT